MYTIVVVAAQVTSVQQERLAGEDDPSSGDSEADGGDTVEEYLCAKMHLVSFELLRMAEGYPRSSIWHLGWVQCQQFGPQHEAVAIWQDQRMDKESTFKMDMYLDPCRWTWQAASV